MSQIVNMLDAKSSLSRLVHDLETGGAQEFIIARSGCPPPRGSYRSGLSMQTGGSASESPRAGARCQTTSTGARKRSPIFSGPVDRARLARHVHRVVGCGRQQASGAAGKRRHPWSMPGTQGCAGGKLQRGHHEGCVNRSSGAAVFCEHAAPEQAHVRRPHRPTVDL